MTNNWLDIALAQLGKKYHSSGAFVAFVMNASQKQAVNQTGDWSPELIDLTHEVYQVGTVPESHPGDLLFWGIAQQPYSVGIYVGGGHFISVNERDATVKMQILTHNWYPTFSGSTS
ncbi:NlpC/P60 family protein [Leuconostoc rapi]|uniref:NlpC/P60 family protein n=1 Tax=Leuconostoc rapi TaxID=1406906 RepID=UPI00195806C8|nr:NlpC/P60 family protein [Leuconostoc rapi]MBM7436276.1 cell wall-associated NlpC family hydrolase [Leuconostoc rapi]